MALAPPRLMPLSALPAGASARIAEIRGGGALSHKLLGLGLGVGREVCVLHQRGCGLVVSSAQTRVAIGGGIADRLWVAAVMPAAVMPAVQPQDVASPLA